MSGSLRMSRASFDAYDRRILDLLQSEGRLTNAELAERVNLSPSQCSRRRQRLEAEGVIVGYHARLDRAALGIGVVSVISVTSATHDPDNARHLAKLFDGAPEVLEAVSLTGSTDYEIKVVAEDLDALSRFINDTLLPHPAVRNVRTAIVLETLKDTTRLPL